MRFALRVMQSVLVATSLALAFGTLQAQVRLPTMGEGMDAGMPLTAERRLGDQIWVEVRRDPSYLDDPVLTDYVERLWWPLVDAAVRRGEISDDMRGLFPWRAFLIRDRSINAFALPGGYVGVHLGLIAGTSSRDELVSVLAHELAHVTQRHIARSIESSGRQSALGLATMILGILAASRSNNPDVARAAITGGQAAMLQGQLNFSRDMEREADRIGHTLMTDAGFARGGMAAMFDKLDKANRLNDSGNFPYLRSHPLTAERIAEAQSRAGLGGVMDSAARAAIDEEHEIMRARARILADPNVPALRTALELFRAAKPPVPLGTAYAASLAAMLLKEDAAVRETLPVVLRLATGPNQRWAKLLQTEVLLAAPQLRGVFPAGFSSASGTPPASSWQRPELVLQGRAVLSKPDLNPPADADFRDVHQALRAWVVRHPNDGLIWQLLADVEAARGNRMAMLRATAEVHLAAGKPDHALLTLQSARRNARPGSGDDAVELAVVDARLAELRRQRAENFQRQGRPDPNERDKRDDFAGARDAEITAEQRVRPGFQGGQNPATLKK